MKVLSRCRHGNPACKVTSHQEECGTDTSIPPVALVQTYRSPSICATHAIAKTADAPSLSSAPGPSELSFLSPQLTRGRGPWGAAMPPRGHSGCVRARARGDSAGPARRAPVDPRGAGAENRKAEILGTCRRAARGRFPGSQVVTASTPSCVAPRAPPAPRTRRSNSRGPALERRPGRSCGVELMERAAPPQGRAVDATGREGDSPYRERYSVLQAIVQDRAYTARKA